MANRDWMWDEALGVLARAERLHRQLFQPIRGSAPAWEPPVDVLESEREVTIVAALPGVAEKDVKLALDEPSGCLVISGQRVYPPEMKTARIHRLELPQGRFERRVPLPPGHYDQIQSKTVDGCLVVTLRKAI
jgi:HSP20 family molecular chaperone IbpA